MSVNDPEIEDLAPPAWVRAHETFWACELGNFDRDTLVGELACGSGQNMLRASSFVGEIIGAESDVQLLDRARRAVVGRPGLAVVAFNPPALPFKWQSLDVLFADLTRPVTRDLSWIDGAPSALREGGTLLLLVYRDTDDARSVAREWQVRAKAAGYVIESSPAPSVDTLRQQLERSGFETVVENLGEILSVVRATRPTE